MEAGENCVMRCFITITLSGLTDKDDETERAGNRHEAKAKYIQNFGSKTLRNEIMWENYGQTAG